MRSNVGLGWPRYCCLPIFFDTANWQFKRLLHTASLADLPFRNLARPLRVEGVVLKLDVVGNLIAWGFSALKYTMMTLEEIGQLMGVTRERVRQIEAKALRKLRPPCFGTDKWMNMDSSDKLEAMMRWRRVVPR